MGYLPTLLALTAAVMLLVRRTRRVDRGARPAQFLPSFNWGCSSRRSGGPSGSTRPLPMRRRPAPRPRRRWSCPRWRPAALARSCCWPIARAVEAVPRSGRRRTGGVRVGRVRVRAAWPASTRGQCRRRHARPVLHECGLVRVSGDRPPSIRGRRWRCSPTAGTAGCRTRSASAGPATLPLARPGPTSSPPRRTMGRASRSTASGW